MKTLSRAQRKAKDAEKAFKYKAILFIPTESYDAATITVLQGLQELGFTIYTYRKPNINSWFCNQVVNDIPSWLSFDFVLSNLHWGTQWHLYNELKLHDYPKVLIDGCDNRAHHTWKDKYRFYCKKYKGRQRPVPDVLAQDIQPYRWMEPLGDYKPDVIFTSQKNPGDKETVYLPFGIHREYLKLAQGKLGQDRSVDFTNVPGPGDKRRELTAFLQAAKLPGRIHNDKVRGQAIVSKPIENLVHRDNNRHSWRRWITYQDYFRLLNDTKIFLYPGVYARPHWDSKRQWEALASGCLVMTEEPPVDMAEYPMTELCPPAVYQSLDDIVDKCQHFYRNPGWAEQHRLRAVEGALEYFTPAPIARYFLWKIKKRL